MNLQEFVIAFSFHIKNFQFYHEKRRREKEGSETRARRGSGEIEQACEPLRAFQLD